MQLLYRISAFFRRFQDLPGVREEGNMKAIFSIYKQSGKNASCFYVLLGFRGQKRSGSRNIAHFHEKQGADADIYRNNSSKMKRVDKTCPLSTSHTRGKLREIFPKQDHKRCNNDLMKVVERKNKRYNNDKDRIKQKFRWLHLIPLKAG